jgi:hypothetical protein
MFVGDNTLVRAFIFLFQPLDTQNDLVLGAISPDLETASWTTARKLDRTLENLKSIHYS